MDEMYPIDPGEEWGTMRIYGSQQLDDYEPLYSRVQEQDVITKWQLTNQDREILANGGCLFLSLKTFGAPLQPIGLWAE
jgi:hypothetical protein